MGLPFLWGLQMAGIPMQMATHMWLAFQISVELHIDDDTICSHRFGIWWIFVEISISDGCQHSLNIKTLSDRTVDSLWPSDIIWQYRSGLTLTDVIAAGLMAPSHYLNQCWLRYFVWNFKISYPYIERYNFYSMSKIQGLSDLFLVLNKLHQTPSHWSSPSLTNSPQTRTFATQIAIQSSGSMRMPFLQEIRQPLHQYYRMLGL